jgi:hypothetical protein
MSITDLARISAIDRLIATEEVKLLRARYCRFIDMKLWDDLRPILHDDIMLDLSASNGKPPIVGRNEFVLYVSNRFSDEPSLHLNFLPEVEIVSPTEATAIWAQEHFLFPMWVEGEKHSHGYAWSSDRYLKVDGQWQVRSVTLLRPWIL